MRHSIRWSRSAVLAAALLSLATVACSNRAAPGLWNVYDEGLAGAKYIDLTHTLEPNSPVWRGFGPSAFGAAVNPETGAPYTYEKDGFEATRYTLATDQLGTQLD